MASHRRRHGGGASPTEIRSWEESLGERELAEPPGALLETAATQTPPGPTLALEPSPIKMGTGAGRRPPCYDECGNSWRRMAGRRAGSETGFRPGPSPPVSLPLARLVQTVLIRPPPHLPRSHGGTGISEERCPYGRERPRLPSSRTAARGAEASSTAVDAGRPGW